MKSSRVFFNHKFKSIITSVFFVFEAVLMCAATAFAYFTRTKFFSVAGTSSLTAYFSFVPYVSIILVPAFCLKKDSPYDVFIPLSEWKKILLNFAAHMTAFFIIICLLMWLPFFVSFYGDVDFGAAIVSFCATVFYGAVSISFCFFVSEICDKKITAFAVSAVFLAALNSCHSLAVYFSLPAFITRLLYGIGFAGRFENASKGIFSSSDFLFFIISSLLLLSVSYLISEKKKGRIFKDFEKRRIVYLVFIFVLLFLNNDRLCFNIDFSEDKLYSVSPYTKRLVNETDDTVQIHFYKSGKLENIYPSIKNVEVFLRQYERSGNNIILKVTDCDKNEKARNLLSGYGISPQRVRTENSTSTEFIDVYSSVVIESGGNIEVIPFVLSPASLEYQLDLKILSLVHGFVPSVNLISGNGQVLNDDLRLLNDWFINQGIMIHEVSPYELTDVSGPLFIFGENNLSEIEVQLIEDYALDGKGNVLFCNSPYSVDVQGDWSVYENRNLYVTDLLSRYGVNYEPSLVMDYSCHRISMMSEDSTSDYGEIINYPFWISVLPQSNSKQGFSVFWASPLELSENAVPFIVSSSYSVSEKLDFNSEMGLCETNPFKVNMQNVQTMSLQNKVLGAVIPVKSAKCTDNVVTNCSFYVISDQLFASFYTNGFIGGESGDFRNFMFLTNLFWKMNGMDELSELQSKTSVDRSLYKRNGGR
ncbi:MAG: GldG family protein [Treponema sp.]|nr:GldG family protein [Treponema sp.]